MKRIISSLLVLTMILTLAVCCAATAEEQPSPGTGGTLVIGEHILDTELASRNPYFTNNNANKLFKIIYEGLVFFNPISGELEPSLATGFEWNADYTQLTFTMNTDAKWHDGQPVTAEDVVFTYEAMKNQEILDRYNMWSRIDSIVAEGDKVVFTISQPYAALPFYASEIYIVPKHIWEVSADISQELNETPVGTGPFVWKSYTDSTDVQLEAFADYWGGAPKVDAMLVKLYNTAPNVTLALLKGDIDATLGAIAMPSVPEFKTKPNAAMQVYAGLRNYVVAINHENPLLADPTVRKALSMAVNQTDLIAKGEYNGVFPASPGWLPEIFGDLQNAEARDSHQFNAAAAMELLESAGFSKGNDGIYQRDGERLSFTYHNASGAPAQQMEAGMIQQWLLNIGVEILPRLATWPELTQLLQTGEYDLLQNVITFPPDPYAALNTSFHSSMTAPAGTVTTGTNYFRYRNQDVDALLDEVSSVTDHEEQKELYAQVQKIIAEDVVFLPMYNLGEHIPYYNGTRFAGWINDAPLCSPRGLIQIYPVQ